MSLDKKTVENFLIIQSQAKFEQICRIILKEKFKIDATNVDGKGDRGGDWIVIPSSTGSRLYLCQTTVQHNNFKKKCIEDAQKAVSGLGCSRFLMLTSRRHESGLSRDIEIEIQNSHSIPATILGAVEIADIIVAQKLYSQILDELGLRVARGQESEVTKEETLLLATMAISDHSNALKDQVYEDAIIMTLSQQGDSTRESIISSVTLKLQCGPQKYGKISSRVDALLMKKRIIKTQQSNTLRLSDDTIQNLEAAKSIYEAQFQSLSARITDTLRKFSINTPSDECLKKIGALAARINCIDSIKSSKDAGLAIHHSVIIDQLGSPQFELQKILKEAGCTPKRIENAVIALIAETRNLPLTLRLARNVLFFALDGVNPITQVRALGVDTWKHVTVLLDASVAIPYLCSELFKPTSGRFSVGASAGVRALRNAGATILLPKVYLNEAAAHLVKAVNYCQQEISEEVRFHSNNGYASFHAELRANGFFKESLIRFLFKLSPSLKQVSDGLVPNVMHDLARLFNEFDIPIEEQVTAHRGDIESIYSKEVRKGYATRDQILYEHDIRNLSWMRQAEESGTHGLICLTWDRLMINVSREMNSKFWCVSPIVAADFITMGDDRDEGELLTSTHQLTSVFTGIDDLASKLIEKLIHHAQADRCKWDEINAISKLRSTLHERTSTELQDAERELTSEYKRILRKYNISNEEPLESERITQDHISKALLQA